MKNASLFIFLVILRVEAKGQSSGTDSIIWKGKDLFSIKRHRSQWKIVPLSFEKEYMKQVCCQVLEKRKGPEGDFASYRPFCALG
jgi:hypothetical protein